MVERDETWRRGSELLRPVENPKRRSPGERPHARRHVARTNDATAELRGLDAAATRWAAPTKRPTYVNGEAYADLVEARGGCALGELRPG